MAILEHGSLSGYVKHKCRCDACKSNYSKYMCEWRKKNPRPRNSENDRLYAKEWRAKNPEKVKAKQERRLRRHPGYQAKWIRENLELKREYTRLAQARRRTSAAGKLAQKHYRGSKPDSDALAWVDIISSDPCVYCGGPSGTIDHITAVSVGGDGQWSNFAPACKSCNSAKVLKSF